MALHLISNLFPDVSEPWRGLDNACVAHAIKAADPSVQVMVTAFRPRIIPALAGSQKMLARPVDSDLGVTFAVNGYIPKFGGWNEIFFSTAVRKLRRKVPERFQAGAMLVPWLFPDACGVARVRELQHLPMVAVAQGSDVHKYLEMPMRRRAILKMSTRVTMIITRSADLRRRLIAAGVAQEKVQTVYNGVDTQLFHPGDRRVERAALGLPIGGKIALFVGNFLPVKGLELMLDSCATVVRRLGKDFRLVLIGGGPLEAALRGQAAALKLHEHTIFVGRKDSVEVAAYMRASDVVCLSSLNEGVPNVILEAMASGRPVLSTNVGGISEIISPRPGSGTLVEGRAPCVYGEALCSLFAEPAEEAVLRKYGTEFSWDRCARAYLSILDPNWNRKEKL